MFKFLEHTADFKIRVEARNIEELFKESLNAINKFLNPKLGKNSKVKELNVILDKIDLPYLILDFLSEILSKIYIEKSIFYLKDLKINDKLEALLEGKVYESLEKEIKAITYHQAKIEKKNNKLILEFIIDI